MKKFTEKRIILLFVSLFSLSAVCAQETQQFSSDIDEGRQLSVEEMLEDVDFYYNTMKQNHPNLYEWYPKAKFDELYRDIKEKCLKGPLNSLDFHYLMLGFNHMTDSHSQISWWNSTAENGFPAVSFLEENIIYNDSKILTIGGVSTNEILKEVDRRTSWEMHPKEQILWKNSMLSVLLKYKYKMLPPYICELLTGDGKISVKKIDAVSYGDMEKTAYPDYYYYYFMKQEVHKDKLQSRFFDADSIAVLYYNSSSVYKKEECEDFAHKIELFFDTVKIKRSKHLFIDVSANGGGSDETHEYLLPYLKYDAVQMEGIVLFCDSNKFIRETLSINYTEKETGFEGDVYIIMGLNTFSAAFDFCLAARIANIGVLAGETSGQRWPFTGNVRSGVLPNTGIKFRYGTKFSEFKDSIYGYLSPDIPYPLTKPLELAYFKEIIKLKNK
jgi:hypothetical protein